MKILLIRTPNVQPEGIGQASSTCPPLGLAYLAGSLREAGHDVFGIDSVGELPLTFTPTGRSGLVLRGLDAEQIASKAAMLDADIIGFSVMFTHEWPQAKKTIKLVREVFPKKLIFAGGEHCTAKPEMCLSDCPELDGCVLGEGEETVVDLADVVSSDGSLLSIDGLALRVDRGVVRTRPRNRIRSIDKIAPPDWGVFPIEPYLVNELGYGVNRGRSMPILATRGCPYQCTFCSSPFMWTTRWLARDTDLLLDEMDMYIRKYQISNFDFYDLTAIVKRDWILEFCKKMMRRGLTCTWQLPSGTRSEAIDEEVVEWLYKSGCRNVSYAPESGSPTVLKRIKKKVNLDRMLGSMRAAVQAGMNVKSNIIIGFPAETHHEILETLGFVYRMARVGVHDIHVNGYEPYPGSELFDELRKKGHFEVMDEEYCYSLVEGNSGVTSGISYSEYISDRMLGWYRFICLSLFYFVRYVLKPSALIRMLRNIKEGKEESRGEHEIINFLKRRKYQMTSNAVKA